MELGSGLYQIALALYFCREYEAAAVAARQGIRSYRSSGLLPCTRRGARPAWSDCGGEGGPGGRLSRLRRSMLKPISGTPSGGTARRPRSRARSPAQGRLGGVRGGLSVTAVGKGPKGDLMSSFD